MSKQFCFKQFSLAYVHSLVIYFTVLFQTDQFSISTKFTSFWPIERTLSSATTPGQNGSRRDGNKGVLKAPALLEPHHQIDLCHIQDTRSGSSYFSAEKQSMHFIALIDRYGRKIEFFILFFDHTFVNGNKEMETKKKNMEFDIKVTVTNYRSKTTAVMSSLITYWLIDFFVKWHINLQILSNAKDILEEVVVLFNA